MKNTVKLFGLTAIIAIITMAALITCGSGDDEGNAGSPTGMEKLEFSGQQVYVPVEGGWGVSSYYTAFPGNLTISDYSGGSGEIKNGKLTFSVETPQNTYPCTPEELEELIYDLAGGYDSGNSIDPGIDTPGLTFVSVLSLEVDGSEMYSYLKKEDIKQTPGSNNSFSSSSERVVYVYVDKDVTINGAEKTEPYEWEDDEEGVKYNGNDIVKAFTLGLKEGWNAVDIKTSTAGSFMGTNPLIVTRTTTSNVSLSNPSLRWVLWEYGGGDEPGP
ncbi:MAG: hypothetical protein LBG91_04690 [Treponema sp.]|nr:hypothetical protein [Treponema sp.]